MKASTAFTFFVAVATAATIGTCDDQFRLTTVLTLGKSRSRNLQARRYAPSRQTRPICERKEAYLRL